MEIHQHTHTPRKKWTHYLWEFLMLFLAVFCGFLAENQREHMVEHQREKQYMQSLLKDLEMDTTTLNEGFPRKEGRIKAIDSVFIFFNSNTEMKSISGRLFKTIRRSTYDQRIDRNSITMNQLKNAGGMRLIRKKNVADAISAYELLWDNLDFYKDFYLSNSLLGNGYAEELVNTSDLLPFYIQNPTEAIVANIPDTAIIKINTSNLNKQLNFMMRQKTFARQEINKYKELEERAKRLMELIKKEYHLK